MKNVLKIDIKIEKEMKKCFINLIENINKNELNYFSELKKQIEILILKTNGNIKNNQKELFFINEEEFKKLYRNNSLEIHTLLEPLIDDGNYEFILDKEKKEEIKFKNILNNYLEQRELETTKEKNNTNIAKSREQQKWFYYEENFYIMNEIDKAEIFIEQ
ncbi:hypothetical protein ACQ4LE_000026 [Meloidogyne hapla]